MGKSTSHVRSETFVRSARRTLRRLGQAAGALALLLGASPALAATIAVDGVCTLQDAIHAANLDAAVGACPAGSGADTITLPASSTITLTSVDNTTWGATGLPVVTSTITIEGNHSRIERAPSAPDFRILAVDSADLTVNRTVITGGSLPDDEGGGIHNFFSTVTLNRCVVSKNQAALGGGLGDTYGATTLVETVVTGNEASWGGGGIWSRFGGTELDRSAVIDNEAEGPGGGWYGAAFLTASDSTISGNTAEHGGGVACSEGGVILSHTTVTGNVATVGSGGGIASSYSVTLSHTIVSGNTASLGAEVSAYWTYADDYNVFGHSGSAGVLGFSPGPSDLVPAGSLSTLLDPVLRQNGGQTPTHALPLGSPAIDLVPSGAACSSTDQRNAARPQGPSCDAGAFERVPDPCANLQPSFGCTVNGVPNQLCIGTSGNDVIVGTSGKDVILGLQGDDQIKAGSGADLVCGGKGSDVIDGQTGNDLLFGETENDTLTGGLGADSIDGDGGSDVCNRDGVDVNVIDC